VEEMAEVAARQQVTTLPPASTLTFHQPEDGGDDTTASPVRSEKTRRRGSLLVSRFGQVPEHSVDIALGQSGVSGTESAVSSLVVKSPLYSQARVPSVDSFGPEEEAHDVGPIDDHVTQMRHISGKPSISQTVGGMISRTISTRRSKNNLKVINPQNLFVGVSVTEHERELEASELENEPEAAKQLVVTTTTVHAPLKKQPSKRKLEGFVAEEESHWIRLARKFGQKIRRKSQAWLTAPGQGPGPTAVSSTTPATN